MQGAPAHFLAALGRQRAKHEQVNRAIVLATLVEHLDRLDHAHEPRIVCPEAAIDVDDFSSRAARFNEASH